MLTILNAHSHLFKSLISHRNLIKLYILFIFLHDTFYRVSFKVIVLPLSSLSTTLLFANG